MPEIFSSNSVIIGDFNIANYVDRDVLPSPSGSVMVALNNFFDLTHMLQKNSIKNQNGHILDLVISSTDCLVERAVDVLLGEDMHHPSLEVKFTFSNHMTSKLDSSSNCNSFQWNFRKANLPMLYGLLAENNWSVFDNFDDSNLACDYLHEQLDSMFEMTVPRTRSQRGRYPPCFNGTIIRGILRKRRLWRRCRRCRTAEAMVDYKVHRNLVKRQIRQAQVAYMRHLESNISSDPANFWKYLSSKREPYNISQTFNVDGHDISDSQIIADRFAQYFQSSYGPSQLLDDLGSDVSVGGDGDLLLHIDAFTEGEVLSALPRLKGKMTAGPDCVPSFVLRDCCSVLAGPLTRIFNLCLRDAVFPKRWKLSRICPVYKKGDKSLLSNYRPMTIISNFA